MGKSKKTNRKETGFRKETNSVPVNIKEIKKEKKLKKEKVRFEKNQLSLVEEPKEVSEEEEISDQLAERERMKTYRYFL